MARKSAKDKDLESKIANLEARIDSLTNKPTVTSLSFSELQDRSIKTAEQLDERFRHVHLRSFPTDQENKRAFESGNARYMHIRPDSVLIAAMGFHWSGENYAWNKVCDMIDYTTSQGYYVGFSELQDRCFNPYDSLGTMRNEAVMTATNEGFEWLLYLDNDVAPEKDTLVKLLQHQQGIVSPYVVEPGTGKQLFGPVTPANSGLIPAKWTVLTMLLFRTAIFRCVGPNFWSDSIGADEGFHFQHLWWYGHRPYVDTDIQLVTGGGPHYPLSSIRLPTEEKNAMWDRINEKRGLPPNRRPMDPESKFVDSYGDYMPWGQPKPQEEVQIVDELDLDGLAPAYNEEEPSVQLAAPKPESEWSVD